MRTCKIFRTMFSAIALSIFVAATSEDGTAEITGNLDANSSLSEFCGSWSSDNHELLEMFYNQVTLAELVKCIEAGLDVGATDKEGRTPLHNAAI